ncbi:MAG TPA: pilus assembly protein PilP [Gammaproteobacteria bacterium]|jgi:type IV pilus assembly protein PilP|nr:pilus assembly protein PilP [Gammaproteobacteria bacterium]
MNSFHSNHRACLLLALATVPLLLAGCGDRMSDLRQYADQVKARKGGYVEPLPQVKPFETYIYADADKRSPFDPQLQSLNNPNLHAGSNSGIHPDFNRNHEYLEQFPLDSLKMLGTLTEGGTLWALIRDGDGIVHRVKTGNYMGQNFGKIISIDDSGLTLREIVPDGQGGWTERTTNVQLGD